MKRKELEGKITSVIHDFMGQGWPEPDFWWLYVGFRRYSGSQAVLAVKITMIENRLEIHTSSFNFRSDPLVILQFALG